MAKDNKAKVDNNVIAFMNMCPYEKLKDGMHLFHCKNGSVILKWNKEHKIVSVNIGTERFSAAIVDTQYMKATKTIYGGVNDEKLIKDFWQCMGIQTGLYKVSYCRGTRSSSEYNPIVQTRSNSSTEYAPVQKAIILNPYTNVVYSKC